MALLTSIGYVEVLVKANDARKGTELDPVRLSRAGFWGGGLQSNHRLQDLVDRDGREARRMIG